MIDVIPLIHGKQKSHFLARTINFGNLDPLMAGSRVAANPDLCYGARPSRATQSKYLRLNDEIYYSFYDGRQTNGTKFLLRSKGT